MIPLTVVLASHNKGKIAEFSQVLSPWHVISISQFSQQAVAEPYQTFVENALAKARAASMYTEAPVLADDSGICVPALGGAPGVHSSRYSGGGIANNRKLLEVMAQKSDKRAYFYCVLVYLSGRDDPTPTIAEGRWWGEIATQFKGNAGFGYDPIFYLPKLNKTAAELSSEEKNRMSHRALAAADLRKRLGERNV